MRFELKDTSKAKVGSVIVTKYDKYLISRVNMRFAAISLADGSQCTIRDTIEDLLYFIEELFNEDIIKIISSDKLVLKEED